MPVGEGGGPNPPYGEDFFQRIVGVHWPKKSGGIPSEVIVVFVANSALSSQPDAEYQILNKGALFLQEWKTPYQASGYQPGFPSRAYRVQTSAGPFMRVSAPDTRNEEFDTGSWTTVLVFAIDKLNETGTNEGAMQRSLDRAIAGTLQVIPAIYMFGHTGGSDIPASIAPPGLLWLVESGSMTSGVSLTWVIRFGKHRNDVELEPPNNMVQCYSTGPSYTVTISGFPPETWTGYYIYAYRLDNKGTGSVYGEQLGADEDNVQNIDAAWSQPISSLSDPHGIPFQDPPPLVAADL